MNTNKWSPEWLKAELIKKIKKYFNEETGHLKLIIFKTTSEYNDETYDYNPILIIVDRDFNEVEHHISLYDVVPDEVQQSKGWDEGTDILVEDLTFEWND